MVCDKCQTKLDTVATPDPWKDGSRNSANGSVGRKVGENKLLGSKANPYSSFGTCKLCKDPLKAKGFYCQKCAFKKGVCSMCGVKILDTSAYRQSQKKPLMSLVSIFLDLHYRDTLNLIIDYLDEKSFGRLAITCKGLYQIFKNNSDIWKKREIRNWNDRKFTIDTICRWDWQDEQWTRSGAKGFTSNERWLITFTSTSSISVFSRPTQSKFRHAFNLDLISEFFQVNAWRLKHNYGTWRPEIQCSISLARDSPTTPNNFLAISIAALSVYKSSSVFVFAQLHIFDLEKRRCFRSMFIDSLPLVMTLNQNNTVSVISAQIDDLSLRKGDVEGSVLEHFEWNFMCEKIQKINPKPYSTIPNLLLTPRDKPNAAKNWLIPFDCVSKPINLGVPPDRIGNCSTYCFPNSAGTILRYFFISDFGTATLKIIDFVSKVDENNNNNKDKENLVLERKILFYSNEKNETSVNLTQPQKSLPQERDVQYRLFPIDSQRVIIEKSWPAYYYKKPEAPAHSPYVFYTLAILPEPSVTTKWKESEEIKIHNFFTQHTRELKRIDTIFSNSCLALSFSQYHQDKEFTKKFLELNPFADLVFVHREFEKSATTINIYQFDFSCRSIHSKNCQLPQAKALSSFRNLVSKFEKLFYDYGDEDDEEEK